MLLTNVVWLGSASAMAAADAAAAPPAKNEAAIVLRTKT